MRPVRAASLLAAASLLVACAGSPEVPKVFALPGPGGLPPPPPSGAGPAGANGASDASGRERSLEAKLAAQLYAPCPDQAVSIRQCVDEARSCAACKPALELISAKVKEGMDDPQIREAYALRFGPNKKAMEVDDSPAQGPASAPITMIVWTDFECPHCRRAMPILDRIVAQSAGKVRVVHKFYPLRSHTNAEGAARAAIAALYQGKFWEMERTLFANQGKQSDSELLQYATDLKLDLNRWHADLTSERTNKILTRDHDEAEKADLGWTPFILINGRVFDFTYFHMESELEAWVKLELELLGKK